MEIPYTGLYNASVYVTAGAVGAKFGLYYSDGTAVAETVMQDKGSYISPVTVPTVRLNQGDQISIYVYGTSSWVNGDDFSLTYDFSAVTENLLNGVDFSQTVSTDVRVPWDAGYALTATVTASEEADVIVKLGNEVSDRVTAGETKDIVLKTSSNLTANDMLNVSIEGAATVTNAELKYNPESMENTAPVASNVTVNGNLYSGEILSGVYAFTDEDGHTEGSSSYRWLISDEEDGSYTAIEGQTSKTLTLTEDYD